MKKADLLNDIREATDHLSSQEFSHVVYCDLLAHISKNFGDPQSLVDIYRSNQARLEGDVRHLWDMPVTLHGVTRLYGDPFADLRLIMEDEETAAANDQP